MPLRCLFLLLQQSPSLRMDQWQQRRLRRPWCEGQVTATFLPSGVSCHGGLQWAAGGGWDGVAFLGSSLRSSAASCRFHSQSHWWISGHHQPWSDGRALWSRQPGLRGQQLHQRCQSSPEHRLRPQPRGECSLLGSAQGEEDGEWHSQGKGLYPCSDGGEQWWAAPSQAAFWSRNANATASAILLLSPRPQTDGGGCSSSLGAHIPGPCWLSLTTAHGPDLQTFPWSAPDFPRACLGPEAVFCGVMCSLDLAPPAQTVLASI